MAVACTIPTARFNDQPEVRDIEGLSTTRKVRPLGRDKQWPLREATRIGSEAYAMETLTSYAVARHSALDLAAGVGLLALDYVAHCDSGDTVAWEGTLVQHNDDRRRPVLWDDGMLLTFDQPRDGFAGYGRLTYDYVVRQCNWQDRYEWISPETGRTTSISVSYPTPRLTVNFGSLEDRGQPRIQDRLQHP